MATDYFSWTVRLPAHELDIGSSDWVAYRLPDAVSDAMGQEDTLTSTSRGDLLHEAIHDLVRVFKSSKLGFLDCVPGSAGSEKGLPEDCDGFVVSALLPADIPFARGEIEEMLHDAARLESVLHLGLTDDKLAQWRERAFQDGPADDGDGDVIWFLQCLAWELECAQEEGTAVVHVRYVHL